MGEHHPAHVAGGGAGAGRARRRRDVRARHRVAGARHAHRARRPRVRASSTMTVRADMLNGHAICHGGFIFTLADSAFAFACNSYNLNTVASGLRDRVPGAGARGRRADGDRRASGSWPGAPASTTSRSRTSAARPIALFRGKSYRIKGHVIDGPTAHRVARRSRDARQTADVRTSSSPSRRASRDELARAAARAPPAGRSRMPTTTCRTTGKAFDADGRAPARPQDARGPRAVSVHGQGGPARQLSVRHVRRAARAGRRASTRRRARPASRRSSATRRKDIDTWATVMARSIRAAGGRAGDIIHVAYGYGLFTGGLGAHYGAEKLGCTVIPMSGGHDREAGAAHPRTSSRRSSW